MLIQLSSLENIMILICSFFTKKTCESSFVDTPFTVGLNPVKNTNYERFSKAINLEDIYPPIEGLFEFFLKELQ